MRHPVHIILIIPGIRVTPCIRHSPQAVIPNGHVIPAQARAGGNPDRTLTLQQADEPPRAMAPCITALVQWRLCILSTHPSPP